ncbi:hypothetical protein OG590_40285 (plasmid) [Streptomyces goshikiensis]|uniref:hypothetical protein n=1 Tax=Streptomyces goshikiensis TaxID=1942 RepID=UPI002F912A3F|nr:hypothetical protein OG590_40285 [Streptomyces goshikiensis]
MPFPLTSPAGSPTHTAGPAPAWPATAAAELSRLAELLAEAEAEAEADATAVPAPGVLAVPGLAASPGDTAGIRVRTISNPPYALYVIAAGRITPHAGADSAFAHLHPLIEAAARPCDGCGAEASKPCNPNCLPDPSTD